MKLVELPYGEVQSAIFKLIQSLGEDGQQVVGRINSEPAFVERVAKLALTGGYEPSTNHDRAREIMGKNFFGPADAVKHFGIQLTKSQLAYLAEIPFSEEVLSACKDTHVLTAVFPISIIDMRNKVKGFKLPSGQKAFFYKQDWYDNQAFASDKGELGWQLVRKTPVENSTSKDWNEQQKLLDKDEETPKAQIMVYTIIGHFLNTGERLFQGVYVRTSSFGSDGYRVSVGDFDAGGLGVNSDWDGDRSGRIGVASARKQ